MRTVWLRAAEITTHDKVVTGGERNPLHAGGKRRAWKVAEKATAPDGRVTLRMVLRGGAADKTDAWITHTFDSTMKLRVLDRSEQLQLGVT